MNRIEDEWLHLKRDELVSRVFENELDARNSNHGWHGSQGKSGRIPGRTFYI